MGEKEIGDTARQGKELYQVLHTKRLGVSVQGS